MFGFLTIQPASGSNALQSIGTASTWLRSQTPRTDVAQRSVVVALHDLAATPRAIDRDAVAALEFVDGAVEQDRQRQVAQYVANVGRSAAIASGIWNSMHEINQAFIGVYKAAFRGGAARQRGAGAQSLAAKLAVLLIRRFSIEIKLHAFRYQRLPSAKWSEAHELYRHVVERSLECVPVTLRHAADGTSTTVQREYLHALLLDRINTGNLSPAEFDLVSDRVRDWSSGVTLDKELEGSGGFLIDIGGKTGLLRRTGRERGPTLRFIDTTSLVARFRREIAALSETSSGAGDNVKVDAGTVAAFEKTWPALAMEHASDRRRAPRKPVAGRAVVAIGMAQVFDQLSVRIDTGVGKPPAAARGDAHANWTVVDRSDASLRLRTTTAAGAQIAVGTLLAVRPEAESEWILGVARRVFRSSEDVAEVGVSIVTSQVVAATLHIERVARDDMHVVVDGVDMSSIGAVFRGLYIPPLRKTDAGAIGTLIVPTTNHDIGRRAVIAAGDEVRALVLREPLEQHADWTWTVVESRRAA